MSPNVHKSLLLSVSHDYSFLNSALVQGVLFVRGGGDASADRHGYTGSSAEHEQAYRQDFSLESDYRDAQV